MRKYALAGTSALYFDFVLSFNDYKNIETLLNDGATINDIVKTSALFQNSKWNCNNQSDIEFTQYLVEKLLPKHVSPENTDTKSVAASTILTWLETESRSDTLIKSIETLLRTDSEDFQETKQWLNNIIEFSVSMTEKNSIQIDQHAATQALNLINQAPSSIKAAQAHYDDLSNTFKPETWLFMVYMIADNNLEAFALADLYEFENLSASPNIQVSVALDRSELHDQSLNNWSDTRYGFIEKNLDSHPADKLVSAGEVNMNNPENLTRFINWSVDSQHADNYGLILWDHGLGHKGIGVDESHLGDTLTLKEINSAIKSSTLETVDILTFDACSMATIEVATTLADVTDYIVASQDIVPSAGINHTSIANSLEHSPGGSPEQLTQSIISNYENDFISLSTMALTSIRADKISALVQSTNAFTNEVLTSSTPTDWQAIIETRENSPFYYDNHSIDILSFLKRLEAHTISQELKQAAQSWETAINDTIISNVANKESSKGLSIYWPKDSLGGYYDNQYKEVLTGVGINGWAELLDNYWDN